MMWKRILAKWKLSADAFAGIDDLQGDQLLKLEERVRRLEREVATITASGRTGSEIERELSLDSLGN